jgi:hypothetical protein
MNAKLCKKLRKQAKRATMGQVNTAYVRNRATAAIELEPGCTRYVYHRLKQLAK